MSYLTFISDEHLFNCLSELHSVYTKNKENINLKTFYKNKVDPIKFTFDTSFYNIDMEKYIDFEISRKNDKTVSNAIGNFHEHIIAGIPGFENPLLAGYDIKNKQNTIFAEIKNKHNTIKGEDFKSIHKKLSNFADKYENATCYLVQIIAKKSCNKVWEFNSKNIHYSHPRVRIISADKFYELITGRKNAFKELCDILPKAINDYLTTQNKDFSNSQKNSIFQELKEKSGKYNTSNVLEQIYLDTFDSYNGFDEQDTISYKKYSE